MRSPAAQDQEHWSCPGWLDAQALPNGDFAEHADFTCDGDDLELATGQLGHMLHEDVADAHSLPAAGAVPAGLLVDIR